MYSIHRSESYFRRLEDSLGFANSYVISYFNVESENSLVKDFRHYQYFSRPTSLSRTN